VSVYVDDPMHPFGRMMMCHMIADTRDELLAMADTIGVQRKWIQKEGTADEHFDICKSKRAKAVAAGAKEVDGRDLALMIAQKRKSHALAMNAWGGRQM
jgi:hypothetical protein